MLDLPSPPRIAPLRVLTPRPKGSLAVADSIRTALGGLIAIAAALGIGRFVYTPILPPMIEALHLSKSEAGLIASVNFAGYLLGALLAAMPGLIASRRLWLFGALAVSAVTTAAMGLTQMLSVFLALRLIGGMASAFVLILSSTIVLERLAEAGRSGLSALHFAGVGTGITVSAVLVAELLRLGEGWQVLWLASGALSFAALLAVAGLLPEGISRTVRSTHEERGAIDHGLRRLVIAYGLFGFGYVITATFLVAIVRATPTIRPYEPVIWIVVGIAAIPSVALWTRLAQPIGIPRAFAIACIVEAAGVLASVAWPTTLGVFLAAVLVGGTFMGLTALGLMGARARATGDPGRALALMTGAFGFGQIVGPLFAGFASDHLGSFTAPSIVAAFGLLAAALLAAA
jgi:predicted MFS family arabinose efflux permease